MHVAVQVAAQNVCSLMFSELMSLGIISPVCSEGNIVASKIGAAIILKSLLNIELDVDRLPDGEERGIGIETVIPVSEQVKEADEVKKY